jgi:hypothetical protein
MEMFEKAEARIAARKAKQELEPVVCNDFNDIKRVLKDLRKSDNVTVSAKIGDDNINVKTDNTYLRDSLLKGMNVIKTRVEAMKGVEIPEDSNMKLWGVDEVRFGVDSFIERHLGAKRNGTRIRWEVQGGTFEYDVFEDKLYEVKDE